jgi:hypothetical protein
MRLGADKPLQQLVDHVRPTGRGWPALGPAEDKEWISAPEPIVAVLKKAFHRRWRHLAEERIEDVEPSIPMGKRF